MKTPFHLQLNEMEFYFRSLKNHQYKSTNTETNEQENIVESNINIA